MKTTAGKIVVRSGIWLLAICLLFPVSGFEAAVSAPAISEVRADFITNASCNICWTTDQPATSRVEYWKAGTGNTVATPEDGGLVTSHTIVLSGLDPGTPYRYRVISRDGGGNQSMVVDEFSHQTSIKENWCPGRDSNPHALRRRILSPLRLPIPPPGHASILVLGI
jgi:hypothetical protein